MKFPTDKILVYDIETDSTDVDVAKLKYFGAYSYLTKKRYYLKGDDPGTIEFIKEMIDNHDVIVGFNQKRYDNPVMNRYGVYFQYKTQIDLWEILSEPRLDPKTKVRSGGKGRGLYMGLKLNSWTLANIVKALELGEYKLDFNYKVLEKDVSEWTAEEEKYIVEYLAQDITITKRLFEYTNNFFYAFTEHLSQKNVERFTYLTASIASLAYKIICYEADLEEIYGDGEKDFDYLGGYVRYPTKESHVGEVLCLDFNSLYPSIFRGFNLFSPVSPSSEGFSGNDVFKIKGKYSTEELGPIEKVVADLYALRKEYKKAGDHREYLIKIIINSLYGITAKPVFHQVYSRHGGEDCTAIGRQMIQHVADVFNEKGFEVLYGDTDSVYVALNGKSKEDAMTLAKELSEYFKANMPFPHDDFGIGLDEEIKAIFFFPDGEGGFKKKNYVYITKADKLKIKGLPIIKSNASKIATKILRTHLKKQIINKLDIKFDERYIKQLIYFELENDLGLAVQTYKVKDFDSYESDTGLYAQIAKQYGSGVHNLIPNNRFGIGKAKRYCTVEEFKKNGCVVQDIDLSVTMNNLEPFISNPQTGLGDFC